ncbi:MAG: hypothetical protein ACE5H9_08120 [Anaerolineae bacterium]
MSRLEHPETCAHCGRAFAAPETRSELAWRYCSFRCEVSALLGGLGPGLRWLLVMIAWGLVAFALIGLVFRALSRGLGENPAAYLGLLLVLILALALLTPWFRRLG